MKYYFAYGSNMNLSQIRERLKNKTLQLLDIVYINNMKLIFPKFSLKKKGGVASFDSSMNDKLWGVIFEVTDDDILKLDYWEGTSQEQFPKYKRESILVTNMAGTTYSAITYRVYSNDFSLMTEDMFLPYVNYMTTIIEGAKECNLPLEYIEKLKLIKTKKYDKH